MLVGGLLVVATPGAGGFARLSSLELQLEIPNAAKSDRTRMVKAMRVGVHNGFPLLVLFIAGVSYLLIVNPREAYHCKCVGAKRISPAACQFGR